MRSQIITDKSCGNLLEPSKPPPLTCTGVSMGGCIALNLDVSDLVRKKSEEELWAPWESSGKI